jgi:hypothetical protein
MVKRGSVGAVGASEKEQHDNRAPARKVRYCGRSMIFLFLLTDLMRSIAQPVNN